MKKNKSLRKTYDENIVGQIINAFFKICKTQNCTTINVVYAKFIEKNENETINKKYITNLMLVMSEEKWIPWKKGARSDDKSMSLTPRVDGDKCYKLLSDTFPNTPTFQDGCKDFWNRRSSSLKFDHISMHARILKAYLEIMIANKDVKEFKSHEISEKIHAEIQLDPKTSKIYAALSMLTKKDICPWKLKEGHTDNNERVFVPFDYPKSVKKLKALKEPYPMLNESIEKLISIVELQNNPMQQEERTNASQKDLTSLFPDGPTNLSGSKHERTDENTENSTSKRGKIHDEKINADRIKQFFSFFHNKKQQVISNADKMIVLLEEQLQYYKELGEEDEANKNSALLEQLKAAKEKNNIAAIANAITAANNYNDSVGKNNFRLT